MRGEQDVEIATPPVGDRARAPRRPRGRASAAIALVTGLFLIVMVSAALQGTLTFTPPRVLDLPAITPPAVTATPQASRLPDDQQDSTMATTVIGSVLLALVAIIVAVLLVLLVRWLRALWADRPLNAQDGAPVDLRGAGEAEKAAPPDERVVRRGIGEAARTIGARADVNEAIVAAWLALEETAEDAGAARAPSETPAEFTVRILRARPGIETSTQHLLDLYHRVRFGGHVADEADREAAVQSLRSIAEGWR